MKMEVFNNEEFGNVRAFESDNQVWFVAKDVCDVLMISNTTQKVALLDDDERSMFNIGRQGEANCVNESGLYSLIITSRKPEAKRFKKWITSEVLPSIRKTGSYTVQLSPAEILMKQAEMMLEMERKAKALEAKQEEMQEEQRIIKARINTFDGLEIENDRQKFNAMIRKYAAVKGISHPEAWRTFVRKYNQAYGTNLTALINNFKKNNQLKRLSKPDFLERTDRLFDALRVADKMLNQ